MNGLIESIRYASREIVRELGLLSKDDDYDLPLSFRHALIELDAHGSLSQVELGDLLRLNKSTVSRMVQKLIQQKLIAVVNDDNDQRYKHLYLTESGKKALLKINRTADQQVHDALLSLTANEQTMVASAMAVYAKALKRARLQQGYRIRLIRRSDNLEMMTIIKKTLKEFGADRLGFAFVDPELENLHDAFQGKLSAYYVIVKNADQKVVGGAGFGPLVGGDESICELKKMYLSQDIRGLGLGYILLQTILSSAKKAGYSACYLETLKSMESANYLYDKCGFESLAQPLGNTGHFGCDKWYLKKLA